MKFSWIIISIALYIAGLAFYTLHDEDKFWVNYHYTLSAYLMLVCSSFSLKKNKTEKEMTAIVFIFLYRAFMLIYFIWSWIMFNDLNTMKGMVIPLCMIGVSGFLSLLGMIYGKYNHYGKRNI